MTKGLPVVRPATRGDAPLVARLWARTMEESYNGILPPECLILLDEDPYPDRWMDSVLRAQPTVIGSPPPAPSVAVLLGSLDDGTPTGFCDAYLKPKPGWLSGIYVREEAKRRGLGRALFQAAAAWFRERGVMSFRMRIEKSNEPGRAFFEAMGAKLLKGEETVRAGATTIQQVVYAYRQPKA